MSRFEGERTPLGEFILQARLKAGLTQEQLANALKTLRHVVIRWETGEHAPQRRSREKLAAILGGHPDDYRPDDEDAELEAEVDEFAAELDAA